MLGRSFIMASFPSCSVLWSDGIPLVHLLKSPVGTIMATLHPDNLRSRQTLPSFWWLHCLGCIVLLGERSAYVLRRAGFNVQIEQNITGTKLDRDPVCGKGHVLSPASACKLPTTIGACRPQSEHESCCAWLRLDQGTHSSRTMSFKRGVSRADGAGVAWASQKCRVTHLVFLPTKG